MQMMWDNLRTVAKGEAFCRHHAWEHIHHKYNGVKRMHPPLHIKLPRSCGTNSRHHTSMTTVDKV